MNALDSLPVTTIIAVIAAVAGAIVVAFGHGLTFEDYLKALAPLVGLVAVGRGINKHGKG